MSQTPSQRSVIQWPTPPRPRRVKAVPFVELYNNRLQGVVSSGSDIERVYVSFIEAGTHNFYCSTNNNRPCGGLGYGTCKHIDEMLGEAIKQYGALAVIRYLGVQLDAPHDGMNLWEIRHAMQGSKTKAEAGEVFSRFLSYLRYLELPQDEGVMPEMSWFTSR